MNYSKINVGMLVSSISLTALLALMPMPAIADEPGDTTGSDAPSATTLKGNVVEVGVSLNNLRDARLSTSRMRKAAANLYDEVTRQQMTMTFNPNLVGSTMIMRPTPTFSGPTLPARKKWVDECMAEIRPIINLFKEDVDAAIETDRQTDVSDKARAALSPIKADAFESIKKSFEMFKQLEALTSTTNYNNSAIADQVNSLDNQMKQLDRSLKRGISILQKEQKRSRKSKSV